MDYVGTSYEMKKHDLILSKTQFIFHILYLPWPECLLHLEVGQGFAVPLKHNRVVHVRFARVLKLEV